MSGASGNQPSVIKVVSAPRGQATVHEEEVSLSPAEAETRKKFGWLRKPQEPTESQEDTVEREEAVAASVPVAINKPVTAEVAIPKKFGKPEASLDEWMLSTEPKGWWRNQLWELYVFLGLHKNENVDPPLEVSGSHVQKEIDLCNQEVNDNRRQSSATSVVVSKKGGIGKTTLTTWHSAFMARALKLPVAIFDGDQGGGLVASRYGADEEDVMSIEELARKVDTGESIDYEDLLHQTATDSETGVMIFHAPENSKIGYDRATRTMQALKKKFAVLMVDTSPGFKDVVSVAATHLSDITLIVAFGVSEESIEKGVKRTIDNPRYGIRNRIDNVLVVIVGMPLRKCNARLAHSVAERCGVEVDQVSFIPYEPYMDDRIVENLKRVSLPAISKRTELAFAQLARKFSRMAVRINQAKELGINEVPAHNSVPEGTEEETE